MIELVDIQILAIVSLVFLAFVAGHLLRTYNISVLPESAAAVILGAIYAVIWYFIPAFNNKDTDFSADSFFLVLLPIIIFESGYSVHRVCIMILRIDSIHFRSNNCVWKRKKFELLSRYFPFSCRSAVPSCRWTCQIDSENAHISADLLGI
jgi:hypothetical protein